MVENSLGFYHKIISPVALTKETSDQLDFSRIEYGSIDRIITRLRLLGFKHMILPVYPRVFAGVLHSGDVALNQREFRALMGLLKITPDDLPVYLGPVPSHRRIIELVLQDKNSPDVVERYPKVKRRKIPSGLLNSTEVLSTMSVEAFQSRFFKSLGWSSLRFADMTVKTGVAIDAGAYVYHYLLTPFGAFDAGLQQ